MDRNTLNIQEIKEIVQSSNLNFLIGAGLSSPFLPILNDIEKRLVAEKDVVKKIPIYKEFFQKVMLPNLNIINGSIPEKEYAKFEKVYKSYKAFFTLISTILLRRKSTILSKQANIFTTNIDIFMEHVLERSSLEYNDGFSGRLNPTFSLSNFKKSIFKRSLHFENVSEIPVFNLIKMHGSLTWDKVEDQILFSKLKHIDNSLLEKDGDEFMSSYDKIAIVNPEKEKFKETVMNLTYYELLRMYSSELEKENTVLFVMGFSMADEHIAEITIRAADSNPTLKIYIFCYLKDEVPVIKERLQWEHLKYSNIEILEPQDNEASNRYAFDKINEFVFNQILKEKGCNVSEDQ